MKVILWGIGGNAKIFLKKCMRKIIKMFLKLHIFLKVN